MPGFPLPPRPFSGEPRRAPADAAFVWLRHGWAFFAASPAQCLAATLLLLLFFLGLMIVPPFGPLLLCLLAPILSAGTLHAQQTMNQEGRWQLGDLLAGFRQRTADLLLLGFICMGGLLLIMLSLLLMIGSAFFAGTFLAWLLAFLIGFPLLLAASFAPALVYFNAMKPIDALKSSILAFQKNWLPMTAFGLIAFVLGFFALLTLGLGFLVFVPVMLGSLYASYRDIFLG